MLNRTRLSDPRRIRTTLGLCVILIATLMLSSCTQSQQDQVVARVGDMSITAGDLIQRIRLSHGAPELVEMIDVMLIHQGARAAGITISDEEMNLRWERAIAEAGSEHDLELMLEQRGIARQRMREMMRTELLLDRLARDSMQIHEQEIEDFYREHRDDYRVGERVKGRMIMLDGREDAETILKALASGGDFAGLAEALSTDPATRDRGGDMGWFERDDYAEAIADAAFAADTGEIVGPIEAPDGWVVLKVEDRKPAGFLPLDEVRDEVLSRIQAAKLPAAREAWIKQARRRAAVQILDETLREETLAMLEVAPPPQPVTLMPVPTPR